MIWSGASSASQRFTGRVPSNHGCQFGAKPLARPLSNSMPIEGVCEMPMPPTISAISASEASEAGDAAWAGRHELGGIHAQLGGGDVEEVIAVHHGDTLQRLDMATLLHKPLVVARLDARPFIVGEVGAGEIAVGIGAVGLAIGRQLEGLAEAGDA